MKKILHVTYDMRIGGTEQVIKNIINANDDPNLDMGIICIESPLGPFADELMCTGITFYQLSRKPGFDFALIKQIRQIIKSNSIDILHCHQYTPWVYGALAAAFTSTQVIFTEHGRFHPDTTSIKRKLFNPALSLFTNHITAISAATKQALVEFEHLPDNKITVIYNGIAPLSTNHVDVLALRKQLHIGKDSFILGTVSRFDPIKNHQMMLRAFRYVVDKKPKTVLIIVGDGEERQHIEDTINDLGLSQNVILTGYIKQPKNYIALFDLFLLSSFSEGTSMTLLESMSLGKPCIVTNVGGNPEVISHLQNGVICENNNSIEFSDAILNVINDDLAYNNMHETAKAIFQNSFTQRQMGKNYNSLYLER